MQKDMTQIRKRAINLPPFIQNVCFIAISWPISASNKYVTYLCVYGFLGPSAGLTLKSELSAQEEFECGSLLFFHSQKNPSLSLNWLNSVLVAPAPVLIHLWLGWPGKGLGGRYDLKDPKRSSRPQGRIN